jgi:threonine synthase
LRVPRAIGDFLILQAVRDSGGTALAVSDADMVRDMIAIGSLEGVSAAPEGGAALSAIRRLVADERIRPDETVVLFNTGGALKYLDVLHEVLHAKVLHDGSHGSFPRRFSADVLVAVLRGGSPRWFCPPSRSGEPPREPPWRTIVGTMWRTVVGTDVENRREELS